MNIKNRYMNKALLTFVIASTLFITNIQNVEAGDWQPVVSDKLLKLPANVIYQRIESDFSASPLATELNRIEQSLTQYAHQIKDLHRLKLQANEQESLDLALDIVDKKSSYVSLLKQSHELRSQVLSKRQALYETVLSSLHSKKAKQSHAKHYQIEQAKLVAKKRANNSQQQVQSLLNQFNQHTHEGNGHTRYQQNIEKIAKLKHTFNSHVMNAKPEVAGVVVSDQEYVRELLVRLSTEREYLEQENTMLSYMTKLVALDAENLTVILNQGHHNKTSHSSNHYQLASQATDLFIDGETHE